MNKSYRILVLCLSVCAANLSAQQAPVGIGTMTPDTHAILDVSSTNKGILLPRLDSLARVQMGSPADGMTVFDTAQQAYFYAAQGTWQRVANRLESDRFLRQPEVVIPYQSTYMDTVLVTTPGTFDENVSIGVTIHLSRQVVSAVSLSLTSPGGTTIDLSSGNGGSGSDYDHTGFTSFASLPITSGTAPFRGVFMPEQSFAAFQDEPLAGNWVLTVTCGGFLYDAILHEWSFDVQELSRHGQLFDADRDTYVFIDDCSGQDRIDAGAPSGGAWSFDQEGHVGIGTSQPLSALDVAGRAVIGPAYASGTGLAENSLAVQGWMGLAKTNPSVPLHIRTSNANLHYPMLLDNGLAGGIGIAFCHHATALPKAALVYDDHAFSIWLDSQNDLNPVGPGDQKVKLDLSGHLGIGVSPKNSLDVAGNLSVGSSYSGTYAAPADGVIIQDRLGIGVSSLANALGVAGSMRIAAQDAFVSNANINPNSLSVEGNMGIGTTSMLNRLGINGRTLIGHGPGWSGPAPANGLHCRGSMVVGPNVSSTAKLYVRNTTSGLRGVSVSLASPISLGTKAIYGKSRPAAGTHLGVGGAFFNGQTALSVTGYQYGGWVSATPQDGSEHAYGVYGEAIYVGSGPRYGIYVEASGGTGSNYGAYFSGAASFTGKVGVGTTTPVNHLDVAGALAVGASYGGVATAPDNGMIVQGRLIVDNEPYTGYTEAIMTIGSTLSHDFGSHGYLHQDGYVGLHSNAHLYSLRCSHRIAATEFNVSSDARLKEIIGISDGAEDLGTLMKIQVTKYRLKDSIQYDQVVRRKVIAQQVREVFPQAVNTDLTGAVPDIFRKSTYTGTRIHLPTDLQAGERVKIISGEDVLFLQVLEADTTGFQVEADPGALTGDTIFVYGREVHDLHTVDYDAIAMLNISATQEQQRLIEALEIQLKALQDKAAKQRLILAGLEQQVQDLEFLPAGGGGVVTFSGGGGGQP